MPQTSAKMSIESSYATSAGRDYAESRISRGYHSLFSIEREKGQSRAYIPDNIEFYQRKFHITKLHTYGSFFSERDTIIDMSERRRAEIEAKKAKLAELRKAREERQKLDNERKNLEVNIYRLLI